MEKIGRCFDETMADRFEHHRGDIIFFNRCSAAGIDRSAAAWIFLALWETGGFFMDITPEKEESARKGPHSMFMPSSFPVEGGYSVGESSALASFFAFSSFCFLF